MDMAAGCEFDCIAEQNAPHFRHFATQNFSWYSSFYNVKSYTNLSLMMNEQKIAKQNFQTNLHPVWRWKFHKGTVKSLNSARDSILLILQMKKIHKIKYSRNIKFYIESNSNKLSDLLIKSLQKWQ